MIKRDTLQVGDELMFIPYALKVTVVQADAHGLAVVPECGGEAVAVPEVQLGLYVRWVGDGELVPLTSAEGSRRLN